MKIKAKEASIPTPMQDTIRHELMSALARGQRSARQLSSEVRISEKEVYPHLEHIKRSIIKSGQRLVVTPPECKKCGFMFSKRERMKKPGRCPVCRGEAIHEPLFSIEENR
jgi:hypothetical protein